MRNSLPSPVRLTSIRPPWATTMPWTIDKPTPVPSPTGLVVKKGSKMRACVASSMPPPASRTASTMGSASPSAVGAERNSTVTTPAPVLLSMAWAALVSRLTMI
jgi:hypothetical protein